MYLLNPKFQSRFIHAIAPENDVVKAYVLAAVSEKTGYPAEMLDTDLDLEADLGVDTVKQAELFATIREHFGYPKAGRSETFRIQHPCKSHSVCVGPYTKPIRPVETSHAQSQPIVRKNRTGFRMQSKIMCFRKLLKKPVTRPKCWIWNWIWKQI